MSIEDYKGYEFDTNNKVRCIVVDDNFKNHYVIIDLTNYRIIASDKYENIEKLIETVKSIF